MIIFDIQNIFRLTFAIISIYVHLSLDFRFDYADNLGKYMFRAFKKTMKRKNCNLSSSPGNNTLT